MFDVDKIINEQNKKMLYGGKIWTILTKKNGGKQKTIKK